MSEPNPNPSKITDAMWRLWTERPDPTWRLGGIYADKRCYHNTVNANLAKWPNSYCIRVPLDLVNFNRDKARGIDWTMSSDKMKLYTGRLQAAALHPEDNRLNAMREFYGTLDGTTVYGLMQDQPGGPWRFAQSDKSHLWHIHGGIFTAFVNDWNKLRPINSVLSGQTWSAWRIQELLVTGFSPEALEQVRNAILWEGNNNREWSIPGRTLGGTVEAIWNNTSAKLTEITDILAQILETVSQDPSHPVHLEPEQIPVLAKFIAELIPSGGTFTMTPVTPNPSEGDS